MSTRCNPIKPKAQPMVHDGPDRWREEKTEERERD